VEISPPPPPLPPAITVQPQTRSVLAATTVTMNVVAVGTGTVFYQWRFNEQNIAGATNSTLGFSPVSAANSGGYSVLVWSAYGSVVSDTAFLAVLADGASGSQPARVSAPPSESPPPIVDSLVLVTHGWEPALNPLNPWGDISWITNICN